LCTAFGFRGFVRSIEKNWNGFENGSEMKKLNELRLDLRKSVGFARFNDG